MWSSDTAASDPSAVAMVVVRIASAGIAMAGSLAVFAGIAMVGALTVFVGTVVEAWIASADTAMAMTEAWAVSAGIAMTWVWVVSADSAIAVGAWTTETGFCRYLVVSLNSFASGSEVAWVEGVLVPLLAVTAASSPLVTAFALAREKPELPRL